MRRVEQLAPARRRALRQRGARPGQGQDGQGVREKVAKPGHAWTHAVGCPKPTLFQSDAAGHDMDQTPPLSGLERMRGVERTAHLLAHLSGSASTTARAQSKYSRRRSSGQPAGGCAWRRRARCRSCRRASPAAPADSAGACSICRRLALGFGQACRPTPPHHVRIRVPNCRPSSCGLVSVSSRVSCSNAAARTSGSSTPPSSHISRASAMGWLM